MRLNLNNHQQPWERGEIKVMRTMAKEKFSAKETAAQLGRTRAAVAYKAMVEGIRFRACPQPQGIQQKIQRKRFRKRATRH